MQEASVAMSAGRAFLVLAAAGLALYSSLSSYAVSSVLAQQTRDQYQVETMVQRLAPAARKLPAAVAVGYITDVSLSTDSGRVVFLTAQYALAPHLLVWVGPTARVEWAVGNFSKPADYAAAGARAGFSVIEDLGAGVLLYRRSKP
jgi:hypothetical protein